MLYIAYLPKSKGEPVEERKINKILKWYTNLTGEEYSIIAAPGYLSKTDNSIECFLQGLSAILTKRFTRKIGFLNGMNGHYKITGGTNTIIDEHNKKLSLFDFEQIKLSPKKEFDHRKMMCFFKREGEDVSEITIDKLDEFLSSIYVGAILIGSSNLSKTTYFGDPSSKGEADVFIFDATKDINVQSYFEDNELQGRYRDFGLFPNDDIVITRSFFGKGHTDTQEFLKDILKDVLKSGLE